MPFLQLITVEGLGSSFYCMGISSLVLVSAFVMEEKGLFYCSCITLVLGLLYQLRYAAQLYYISLWLTLALAGAAVVLLSSYLERNFAYVLSSFKRLRQKVTGWR